MKALLLLLLLTSAALAHDHFGVGIVDTNINGEPDAGEPLQFVGASGTDRIFHLLARPVGFRPVQRCGGYYMLDERPRTLFPLDAFSIVALSDGQTEDEEPNHAHPGTWIWAEIVSVSGPAGARFGYWEADSSAVRDTPSISFETGKPTGNFRFQISEGTDSATEDPFGHIHGRSWTADQPGDYVVGIRLIDRSTTGPGGGPWHAPSAIYYYRFQAGPAFRPAGQLIVNTGYVLTWPSRMGIYAVNQSGIVFNVERTTSLTTGPWTNIGSVTGTTADTVSFTDANPPATQAFYRLKYNWRPQ